MNPSSPDVFTSVTLSGAVEPTVTDLSLEVRRILVRETQFPSINPLPTVGVDPFLQAAYNEQANQWTTSPCTNTTTNAMCYLYSAYQSLVHFNTQTQTYANQQHKNCRKPQQNMTNKSRRESNYSFFSYILKSFLTFYILQKIPLVICNEASVKI